MSRRRKPDPGEELQPLTGWRNALPHPDDITSKILATCEIAISIATLIMLFGGCLWWFGFEPIVLCAGGVMMAAAIIIAAMTILLKPLFNWLYYGHPGH